MSSMLLHLLSLAYFSNPISILFHSSSPGFEKASARHLAKTTPSSRAEHPPWPISGVMGWRASPATQTLPLLIFPHNKSHGRLYFNGDVIMLSRLVFSTMDFNFSGKFPRLVDANCFSLAGFSSSSLSTTTLSSFRNDQIK
ncbi:hypothetical protein SLEP1_g33652 [Rubroshorea leprosula]|uniref:Uncharacterized protein n=1 Tax=Rubroshorea leprosula TaxID=152421 RepID=A0AAV5KHH9_9ROSI|nr:hypothetical protein SLEP1_g33652 [Rubroshorea leprosula]